MRLDLHRGALARGRGGGVGDVVGGVDPRGIGEVVSVVKHVIGLAALVARVVCVPPRARVWYLNSALVVV